MCRVRFDKAKHALKLDGDERIGHPLLADARPRAMAANETDVVAKRQQLFLDRPDQGRVAAARQVGAPDRTVEQDVADMGEAQLLAEIDHAARRMTGAMQDVEGKLPDPDLIALVEEAVGLEVAHP